MTTKTFTTKGEAVCRLLVPALGEYAGHYDLDGLADSVLDFDADRRVFFQSVTTDEFWEVVPQHELQLDVEWVAGTDEVNAVWKVVTSRSIEQDAVLASGAVQATEDEDESLANLDAALSLERYRRGDPITNDGDFSSFDVTIAN